MGPPICARAEPAFTVRDTPATVRRIRADLADVVATVRAGDPGLRALVLTGGFARGEGAVRDGIPQNDYDFVALRAWRRSARPYRQMQHELTGRLGLHIDLAPVAAARLRWVPPSIFWYETALRGRTLWGESLLQRIRVRTPDRLAPGEGLRLLVNRAAGLLLATDTPHPDALRLQAAKALLAASDVHLFARGEFPPTQTERQARIAALLAQGRLPAMAPLAPWFAWGFRFKVDPGGAPVRDPQEAWRTAAGAVLAAVPAALRRAGLRSLDDYARRDGLADRLVYLVRAGQVAGARRWAWHPTSRVRVATLRILADSVDGTVHPDAARKRLGHLAAADAAPLRVLDALRQATLQ